MGAGELVGVRGLLHIAGERDQNAGAVKRQRPGAVAVGIAASDLLSRRLLTAIRRPLRWGLGHGKVRREVPGSPRLLPGTGGSGVCDVIPGKWAAES